MLQESESSKNGRTQEFTLRKHRERIHIAGIPGDEKRMKWNRKKNVGRCKTRTILFEILKEIRLQTESTSSEKKSTRRKVTESQN